MAHATKRLLLLLATITLAGCATTSALRSGEDAEAAQDYDRAIVEYTLALFLMALALVFGGGGALSIDALLSR